MAIKRYFNTTNSIYKLIKYCLMFAFVFLTMLTLPDCVLSFKNILLIVMFITIAYILLDLMIPNTVVLKLRKVDENTIQTMQQKNKNELGNLNEDTIYP